nr:hypothetical protein [Tanacetum cinerariifolium]
SVVVGLGRDENMWPVIRQELLQELRDSVSLPPLVAKPKKGKSQTVAPTLPKSQGPKALGALSKKRTKPKSKRPPTKTKESPPKPIEGYEKSHLVSSGTEDQTQSSRLRYQSLTGNEGEPSYEGEPDTQPMLLSYVYVRAILLSEDEAQKSDEKVLAVGDDMDKDHQDDKEVRTPSPKQYHSEPSHVQEYASDSPSADLKRFENTLPLTERQLIRYLRKMSRVLFNRTTKKQWEQHEEATVSYADLKASVDQYYNENITHRDQTEKLVEASMSSLDKSSTAIGDIYKGMNVITQLLKEISNTVKDDPATNQKINESTETFARLSSHVTEVLSLVKIFNFYALLSTVKSIQDHDVKQEGATTAWMKTSTNMAWNLGFRMSQLNSLRLLLKGKCFLSGRTLSR